MLGTLTRRTALASIALAGVFIGASSPTLADDKVLIRLSSSGSETGQRAVALLEKFGPGVAEFAEFQPAWNSTLFAQGTELEAIARGNLEMSITSAQELAEFFPEFSVFGAGYVHRDADHQVAVFNDPLMDPFKQTIEDELGIKLLSVMYLGRRQVNLRQSKDDLEVKTPADLAGVQLRMPGTDSWQFLGQALGASPTPMAFAEVYTALQTGAVDGQDNPLPTVVDAKFYEVTGQIILTSHLADLNYIAFSKELWDSLTPEQQEAVQKAADEAAELGRVNQLKLEDELVVFLQEQGLDVYEPDLEAFRTEVQAKYLESDLAASWPEGILDQINAAGSE